MSNSPQVDATQLLSNIPFSNLIGGPMSAAIQAQAQAAYETAQFIYQIGLTGSAPSGSGSGSSISGSASGNNVEARTVTFTYSQPNQAGTEETVTLTVPLLTIVPIPYLRIDHMTIAFKANINATTSAKSTQNSTQTTNKSWDGSFSVGFWSVNTGLKASYSSKSTSTGSQSSKYDVQYTLDVHVHAVQDSMPGGLLKVLNILQDSIKAVSQPSGSGSGSSS